MRRLVQGLVKGRGFIVSALALLLTGGVVILNAAPQPGKNIRQTSEIFDTAAPFSVIAAIPDVTGFMAKLREGDAMRGFFDSPLGLHFLRSAPLRGAAHLHRLISLAPRSWQWNLYSLITDGPVFYRSAGKKFSLVLALNNKGKLITSLVADAHAVKEGDWFVIASDKDTLKDQVSYLQKPVIRDFALDVYLRDAATLNIAIGSVGDNGKKKSLVRALIQQAFGDQTLSGCNFKIRPGADALGLEGECANTASPAQALAEEKISFANLPGYAYFRRAGAQRAHVLAFGGFAADYGYMIPRLFYSGPSTDQKSIEFLSQAFKTKSHKLETKGDALQIVYPSPYSHRTKKIDLFAPHLVANRERFFWNSYLSEEKAGSVQISLNPAYNLFVSAKIHPLIKNSEIALKQFDALYSPGHFNEFRDALAKSTPMLKNASLKLFTQVNGKRLRVGGALAFAEN
jgi:hypothetical protein